MIIMLLVEYLMRCCGFSYDLRKTNLIKTTQKEGKQYDNVWYKNQINQSHG
jgi:hypothetical protein